MITIEASWVRPGRGVAVGVAAAISELQGADRLAEVIVVVPPGATAGTLRRLLPRVSGGVAGIRFLTPIDLAVELVDSSVSTMRAVTTQLQLAAITAVLSSDECPAALHAVRDHPATIDALVDMAQSLRAAHVHPRALRSLAGDPGVGARRHWSRSSSEPGSASWISGSATRAPPWPPSTPSTTRHWPRCVSCWW